MNLEINCPEIRVCKTLECLCPTLHVRGPVESSSQQSVVHTASKLHNPIDVMEDALDVFEGQLKFSRKHDIINAGLHV